MNQNPPFFIAYFKMTDLKVEIYKLYLFQIISSKCGESKKEKVKIEKKKQKWLKKLKNISKL